MLDRFGLLKFPSKEEKVPNSILTYKTNWDGGVGRPAPFAHSERAMTVLLTFITERSLMRLFETPPTWFGCGYERWRKNMDGKNKLNQIALILFLWKETIWVTALEVTGIGKPICVVITEQVWTCIALLKAEASFSQGQQGSSFWYLEKHECTKHVL